MIASQLVEKVVPVAEPRPSVTFVPADAAGVARIVIDRPDDRVNAIDLRLMEDLAAAIAAARDARPRGLVVASGKADQFVAGADLSLLRGNTQPDMEKALRSMQRALDELAALPFVTVAAINGPAIGGGLEIALACDTRIAADAANVRIGLTETRLGLIPAAGGTQRLPRLIGRQKALDMMLRGTTLPPQDALAAGIVDEVVPAGELVDRTVERARVYATGPTFAIGRIKLAMVQGFGMRQDEGLKLERELLIQLFKSEDAKEGVTAFVEKRKPSYKGK